MIGSLSHRCLQAMEVSLKIGPKFIPKGWVGSYSNSPFFRCEIAVQLQGGTCVRHVKTLQIFHGSWMSACSAFAAFNCRSPYLSGQEIDVDLSCGSVVEPLWKQHCLDVAVGNRGNSSAIWLRSWTTPFVCCAFKIQCLSSWKHANSKLLTSKKKTHISGTNPQNIPIYIYIALLTPTHPLRQPAGEGANRQQKDAHVLPDRYLPTLF